MYKDIKLCKNRNELDTLMQAVRIYCQVIGIEFGIKMCHANNEKWETVHD